MRTSPLRYLTPAVPRRWLFAAAGVAWAGVGVALGARAVGWLGGAPLWPTLAAGAGAMGVGALMYRYVFRGLAARNGERISRAEDRACVFGFQSWRGWATMAFMIALGVGLRASGLPRPWLGALYAGIGMGLALSSLSYAGRFAASSDE
ncbi:MAG: hypothetical protein IBX62_07920 [Coriobacteriia bacterium]|nr:hypothetical protein [Coriobacteriia bacterium]